MEGIKWDVFTAEEHAHIENLLARGEFDAITHAIAMDSLEKEYWVNKILEEKKPVAAPIESKVLTELELENAKGNIIDSPEKEAEWQKKIDDEKSAHVEKVVKQRNRLRKVKEESKENNKAE